jgi:hypothetical protein
MNDNEKWYDKEIAPKLKEISRRCEEKGVAFVATVEYEPGERGSTYIIPKDAGLAMIMLRHCSKMGENVDGYIIGLKKYALEHGIDISGSIYLSR